MKNSEIIKKNQLLQKQLNEANKHYYEEVLAYLRFTLKKNHPQYEVVLLKFLHDLLEAQKKACSAEEFFGKKPQELGATLITRLQKESKKNQLKLFTMVFLILLQVNLIDTLMEPVVTVSLFKTGLPILLLAGALYLLVCSLKSSSFKQKKYFYGFLALLCWIGAVIIPIINDKMNGIGQVTIVSHQFFALILLLFSSVILIKHYHSRSSFSEFFPSIIFILLELSVLLRIIDPLALSNLSKLLFSLMLLVCVLLIPLSTVYRNQTKL